MELFKVNQLSEISLYEGEETTDDKIIFLTKELISNSSLTFLHVGYDALNEEETLELVKALIINRTLTTLEFHGATDAKIVALTKAIKHHSSLSILDLRCNIFSNEGAQVLSEALNINSSLTHLNLSCGKLNAVCAQMLSRALMLNRTLTTLHLGDNHIGDKGLQALSAALKVNSSLNTLHLNDNQISDKGAKALSEALKINRTLITVHLDGNPITEMGMQALSNVFEVNKMLTTFYFYTRFCNDTFAKTINEGLESNKEQIKNTRNDTTLIVLLLLKLSYSEETKLPFEIWKIIIKQIDFPSQIKGYRTSKHLAEFLAQTNIFDEFTERIRTQQSFRLVETHGVKLGESRFSFLVPFKRKLTPDSDYQPELDEQPVLKKAKYN